MALGQYTCKNCSNRFSGKYCNQCGEKVYTEHDKSIGHILEEGVHFITHFEGKFFLTLKSILFYPGKLSLGYCTGIRKKYFKPLSFFLLLVVIYLLFPLLRGLNMPLEDHMGNRYYTGYATTQVSEVRSKTGWTLEQTVEKFEAVSGKVSKFLLFIIIPVMALVSWLLARSRRKPFFDHFIFSTEMASFFLLWGFLLMPLVLWLLKRIIIPLGGKYLFEDEIITLTLLIVPFFICVYKASRRFYQQATLKTTLFSGLYVAVFMAFILTIYKFLLFAIAVQLLH